ncbi:MAG: exosortase H-associated membrane protein [Burkholderiales bacterium]
MSRAPRNAQRRAIGSIGGFFARVLLFFAIALALWYAARQWVVLPPAWLAEHVMGWAFPHWVRGAEAAGDVQTLITALTVAAPDGRIGEVTVEAGALKYAYGAPLLAALLFATWPRGLAWKLPLGLLLLFPFQAWGICAEWLVHVAVQLGPAVADQAGFGAFATNLIGAGYQLGFLILPSLTPVLIWLVLDRRLVATVLLEGALSGYEAR